MPRFEVLIPDFKGNRDALKTVLTAKPDVLNHNIETVAYLYSRVRPEAIYERSLSLLQTVKSMDPAMPVKSGIMVGLGETLEELEQTLRDLFSHGCNSQYLQPSPNHLRVENYYSPEAFEALEKTALKIGFQKIAAGPFVRISYQAHELSGL